MPSDPGRSITVAWILAGVLVGSTMWLYRSVKSRDWQLQAPESTHVVDPSLSSNTSQDVVDPNATLPGAASSAPTASQSGSGSTPAVLPASNPIPTAPLQPTQVSAHPIQISNNPAVSLLPVLPPPPVIQTNSNLAVPIPLNIQGPIPIAPPQTNNPTFGLPAIGNISNFRSRLSIRGQERLNERITPIFSWSRAQVLWMELVTDAKKEQREASVDVVEEARRQTALDAFVGIYDQPSWDEEENFSKFFLGLETWRKIIDGGDSKTTKLSVIMPTTTWQSTTVRMKDTSRFLTHKMTSLFWRGHRNQLPLFFVKSKVHESPYRLCFTTLIIHCVLPLNDCRLMLHDCKKTLELFEVYTISSDTGVLHPAPNDRLEMEKLITLKITASCAIAPLLQSSTFPKLRKLKLSNSWGGRNDHTSEVMNYFGANIAIDPNQLTDVELHCYMTEEEKYQFENGFFRHSPNPTINDNNTTVDKSLPPPMQYPVF